MNLVHEHEGARTAAEPLRVLLAVQSLCADFGGPVVTVSGLADALSEAGLTVGLTAPAGDGVNPCRSPATRLRIAQLSSTARARELVQGFFDSQPPVLIHDNGIWLPYNHRLSRIARKSGIPRVVGPCGMLEPWAMRHHAQRKRLAWFAYQKRDLQAAAVIHARTTQEAEHVAQLRLGRPIAMVTNGMHLPDLALRAPRTVEGRTRTVLFMSRIHPKKGVINLVRAWAALRPAGWKLVVAGPSEQGHGSEVQSEVARLGVQESVEFPGSVQGERKRALFAAADLFVLPSFSENFGVAVAEALSWQIPVITTRGTPWGALVSEQCGWWIAPEVEALVETLRAACALTDAEREEMGGRGRALVEREFCWTQVAKQMGALYRWVLGRGPRPEFVFDG